MIESTYINLVNMDYKTEITQEKLNQNKLWSSIFNQSNLKE